MSTGTDRTPNDDPSDSVAVGRIGPAHGVRGAVLVEPWTDVPDERFAAGSALLTDPPAAGPLHVESMGYSGGRLVVQFAGSGDRASAAALRGITLCIPTADRPALRDPEQFYDTDLIGLAARTVDDAALGPVRDVLHAGGADYLVIDVEGRERLVPFVAAIVPTVDVAGGMVVVDPPDGLFEI